MNQAQVLQAARRNRLYLIGIILLFALPMLLAWWLVGHWRPAGSVHHGELLNPARPLPELQLERLDGSRLSLEELRGRWHLVYLGDAGDCAEVCRSSLHNMRQIRLSLGKNLPRLSNLLLFEQRPADALNDWLALEHADMLKLLAGREDRQLFPAWFADPASADATLDDAIYLIDPLGNLVLRYTPDIPPGDILDDIERLLKYSRIG